MNRSIFLAVLLCVVSVSCVKEDSLGYQADQHQQPAFSEDEVLQGWVRIKFSPEFEQLIPTVSTRGVIESGSVDFDRLAERFGATKALRVFAEGGRFSERRRKAGLHLWYDLYFEETFPVTRAVSDFSALSEIQYAEPIEIVRPLSHTDRGYLASRSVSLSNYVEREDVLPTNDPFLSRLWNFNNIGSSDQASGSIKGADINLFEAWKVNMGHRDVIVAVLDGGIDFMHEDLRDNMWVNEKEIAGNNVDDDDNGYIDDIYGWNYIDKNGDIIPHTHGTHVGGTISAVNNNGVGLASIAGGSGNGDGVRLMSCMIFKKHEIPGYIDHNAGSLDAFAYAADNGAVIAQCSWGSGLSRSAWNSREEAYEYFIQNAGLDEHGNQVGPMKGGVIIAAAGNGSSSQPIYPANYRNVIAVGSITNSYTLSSFSNYGTWVDIVAPGGRDKVKDLYNIYSAAPDNSYDYDSGTSMACPHVSGVAALIVSEFGVGNPGFTADDLKRILLGSARNIDQYNTRYIGLMGVGLVDAGMAMEKDLGTPPSNIQKIALKTNKNGMDVSIQVPTAQRDKAPVGFRIFYSQDNFNNQDPDPSKEGVGFVEVINKNAPGEESSHTITKLQERTLYYFAVQAVDKFGNASGFIFDRNYTGVTRDDEDEEVIHGVKENIDPIYFDDPSSLHPVTINLDDYFFQHAELGVLTYSAFSSNPRHTNTAVSDWMLTIEPLTYGYSTVTVRAYSALLNAYASQEIPVIVRDAGRLIDMLPTLVEKDVYIMFDKRITDAITINILNSTGQKVMSFTRTIENDLPFDIDFSGLKTGNYTAVFKTNMGNATCRFSKK